MHHAAHVEGVSTVGAYERFQFSVALVCPLPRCPSKTRRNAMNVAVYWEYFAPQCIEHHALGDLLRHSGQFHEIGLSLSVIEPAEP